jgi:hypothetical protein
MNATSFSGVAFFVDVYEETNFCATIERQLRRSVHRSAYY